MDGLLKLDCNASRSIRDEDERVKKKGQSTLLVPLPPSHTEQTRRLHAGHTSITEDNGIESKSKDNIEIHVLVHHSL